MAKTDALRENVATNLLILDGEIDALPERAREKDYGPWRDGEWMTNMARFEWLVDLASDGQLEAAEQAEYERVLGQLGRHSLLAEQLGLPVPEKVRRAMLRAAPSGRE